MRDAQRFRKLTAGAAMILSPILGGVSWLLWPTMTDDARLFVTDTLDVGKTRVIWSSALMAASIALAIVAVMGLVHLLHDRRGVLGSAGGGIAIVGLTLVAATAGFGLFTAEAAFGDLSLSQKAALYDGLLTGSALFALSAVGGIAMTIGLITLAVALGTARVVPLPSAYLLAVFGIVQVVGFALYSGPIVLTSFFVLAAALIPVGYEVLVESDEAWEHPPVFHGYHMAAAQ